MSARTIVVAAACAAMAACGAAETPAEVIDGMETSAAGITSFVKEGKYKSWTAEPAPKATQAPHQEQTRVYFNDALKASMQAGNSAHPKGSIAVKELHTGGALGGHAVQVKIADGAGADTIIFFEGTAPNYQSPTFGKGMATCVACHKDGKGFIFSVLP